jgi:hypothetical protein
MTTAPVTVAALEAKPDGQCCEVLKLALSRLPLGRGLSVESRINFKTGETSDALVVQFRKGRKDEEHRNSTFAWCLYCPFCGTKTALQRLHDEKTAALARALPGTESLETTQRKDPAR